MGRCLKPCLKSASEKIVVAVGLNYQPYCSNIWSPYLAYLKESLKEQPCFDIMYLIRQLGIFERQEVLMAVCYNKLWKLMIDKKMTKTQLCHEAKISTNAVAKMGRDEDVRVEVLAKICNTLNCTMDDIIEVLPEREDK